MITQGKLPFKLEITDEEITPRSGLALYAEVLRVFRIEDRVEEHLPQPGSNRGYKPWRFVEPLLLMLYGGGRHIEDLREIRDDVALRRLIGLEEMPSLSTFGDWLSRCGEKSGVEGIGRVNGDVARRIPRKDQTQRYTLDVDATVIEAEKQGAEWTYKKVKGYQPILGFIAENGVCLSYEFREGNVVAGARAVEFLEECERVLPEGKEMNTIRSDSAFYQAEVLNWCEERGKSYTITAGKDRGVMEAIATVRDWKKLCTLEGEEMDREAGTAIHIMQKTEQAFRLVVQRWKNAQRDLFKPEDWCYHVIATNLDDLTPEE
ncbi:MAG: IS1380 family transposase, partial [Candidatus Aminicenantaceae bacterium]